MLRALMGRIRRRTTHATSKRDPRMPAPWLLAPLALGLLACCGGPPEDVRAPNAEPRTSGLGHATDVSSAACPRDRARAALDPAATPAECRSDAECIAGLNGRCVRISNRGGHGPSFAGTRCSYDACFSDADCGEMESCECAARTPGEVGEGHSCVPGECARDGDCGAGRYCRRTRHGRYCHSPTDECADERDCAEGQICARSRGDGPWRCAPFVAPVG